MVKHFLTFDELVALQEFYQATLIDYTLSFSWISGLRKFESEWFVIMHSCNLVNLALGTPANRFFNFVLKGRIFCFYLTGAGYCVADLFEGAQALALQNFLVY